MVEDKKYHKKTILQVLPALISGGVERGTLEIARKLQEDQYNSIVISAGGPLVKALTDAGLTHIQMNVASKNPITIWYNARKIAAIISQYNVDIIHVRSRAPAWSCYLAAKKTGIKFITTFHGIYNFSNPVKKYYNSIMTKGDKIIAVSNFVKDHIINTYNVEDSKITVIHRGVNHLDFSQGKLSVMMLDRFKEKYHVTSNAPIILLPARMSGWKGHLFLIEALKRIKHLDFYCIMAGDLSKHPTYVNRIQGMVQKYRLQSKIQIFADEPEILGLYGIANIVLSTSIEPEAFGRTIIEAQAMEKLVIATNIGGACETITDGYNGFHITPKNISELADKLQFCLSLLNTPEEKIITANARKTVIEKFSLDLMLKSTINIYDQIS